RRQRKAHQARDLQRIRRDERPPRGHRDRHRRPPETGQSHRDALREPQRTREPREDVHEGRAGEMVIFFQSILSPRVARAKDLWCSRDDRGVRAARLLARCFVAALLSIDCSATTFRVFGSAGAEAALTPANESSPLNPHNVAAIPYSTNSADAPAFVEA